MRVTKYSALVEFKTWSGPRWARPGLDMPALWKGTDRLSNPEKGTLMILNGKGSGSVFFGKSSMSKSFLGVFSG